MDDRIPNIIPGDIKVVPVANISSYVEAETNLLYLETQACIYDGNENEEIIHDAYRKQEKQIKQFIQSVPNFDSTILYNNIKYLLKKNNMRIGDFENILGISAGYISKTIKPGSSKNISVDVIWKMTRIFNIDVKTLMEKDLLEPASDYQLLTDMLDKLIQKTASRELHWDVAAEAKGNYYKKITRSIVVEKNGHPTYIDSSATKARMMIEGKVYCAEFTMDKDVVIVPYVDNFNKMHYEFYLVKYFVTEEQYVPELVYNTTQEESGELEMKTDMLYKCIAEHDNDLHVSDGAKSSIEGFLEDLPF